MLGSVNLDAYVMPNGQFDLDRLDQDTRKIIRYLDDILEEGLDLLPLQEQKEAVSKYRQLGMGVMGFADALIRMGIRYGSADSLVFIHRVGPVLINAALQESALMAKERGVYPAYKKEKVLKSNFLKEVAWPETMEMIEQFGLRNAELLSIAPTGLVKWPLIAAML